MKKITKYRELITLDEHLILYNLINGSLLELDNNTYERFSNLDSDELQKVLSDDDFSEFQEFEQAEAELDREEDEDGIS